MKRRKNTFAPPPPCFPFKLYRVDSGLLFVWPKCFFIFTIKSVTYFLFYSAGCVADTMGLVPAFIIYHSNKVECVSRGSPGRLPAHYSLADLWSAVYWGLTDYFSIFTASTLSPASAFYHCCLLTIMAVRRWHALLWSSRCTEWIDKYEEKLERVALR